MPILVTPYRSPFIVIDAIKNIIKDRVVCELECACGDLMVEMQKYAREVKGIELNPDMVIAARARGLNAVEGDVFTNKIPEAEVYYIWCDSAVMHLIPSIMQKGIWIIVADVPNDEPLVEVEEIKKLGLNGYWIDVEYNEGDGWRQKGTMKLFVTEVK